MRSALLFLGTVSPVHAGVLTQGHWVVPTAVLTQRFSRVPAGTLAGLRCRNRVGIGSKSRRNRDGLTAYAPQHLLDTPHPEPPILVPDAGRIPRIQRRVNRDSRPLVPQASDSRFRCSSFIVPRSSLRACSSWIRATKMVVPHLFLG